MKLLVTGSAGLIGRAVCAAARARGDTVVGYDLVDGADVRDGEGLAAAARDVDGIVHLAAVSRVVWGERDPDGCVATNVGGTANALEAARRSPRSPFVAFASSREVYGEPDRLPVDEDAPVRPINVYGHTKARGEALTLDARSTGRTTAVVRLSNVFGDAVDHLDRVVPAFVGQALADAELRVDGADHTFDFTFLDDVVRGWLAVVDALAARAVLPPIHLVSGVGTTLGELAAAAIAVGGGGRIRLAPPRDYDVRRFVGDPTRARAILGWSVSVSLADGLRRLAAARAARGDRPGR
ncbi:MAG: NAD-dependent epimerase/dehydratase family protein [Myxococcota bacterium]